MRIKRVATSESVRFSKGAAPAVPSCAFIIGCRECIRADCLVFIDLNVVRVGAGQMLVVHRAIGRLDMLYIRRHIKELA